MVVLVDIVKEVLAGWDVVCIRDGVLSRLLAGAFRRILQELFEVFLLKLLLDLVRCTHHDWVPVIEARD
jgi:hypothetical protein